MSDDRDWLDELYAEGRDETPPAALDAAILAAARGTAGRPWYRNLRYLTTLATAASFVLAALVVYLGPDDESSLGAGPLPVPAAPVPGAEFRKAEPAAADAEMAAPAPPRSLEETAATPAEPDRQDATLTSGRTALTSQTATRLERTVHPPARMMDNLDAGAATEADQAAILADLTVQCGSPPGSEATRTLYPDALGWYLAVRSGDTRTDYRCVDRIWQVIDPPVARPSASEQEPDPDDDE